MNTAASPAGAPLEPLQARYLLVIQIATHCDAAGRRFVDPLWHKDLSLHLDYIANFSLACPRVDGPVPPGWVEIADPRIRFVDLPSRRKLTLRLPTTVARLWTSIGRADIVHSGVGGWLPISIGNLTALFAKLRGKYLLIVVHGRRGDAARSVRRPSDGGQGRLDAARRPRPGRGGGLVRASRRAR